MLDPLIGVISFGALALLSLGTAGAFLVWRRPIAEWLDVRFPQATTGGSGRARVIGVFVLESVLAVLAISGFVFHLVQLGAEK